MQIKQEQYRFSLITELGTDIIRKLIGGGGGGVRSKKKIFAQGKIKL